MLLNVLYRRQNGLDDQPNHEKENVSPSYRSQEPTTKQQKINKSNPINTRSKWNIHTLKEAMDAIERGTTSLRNASGHQKIPLTSLLIICMEKKDVRKQDQQVY